MIALVLGVLPNVPGFLHQAHFVGDVNEFWTKIYTYAWFVGFAIAATSYFVLESRARTALPSATSRA
jgi:NCS1 family nucleobase:cation symporter-1